MRVNVRRKWPLKREVERKRYSRLKGGMLCKRDGDVLPLLIL